MKGADKAKAKPQTQTAKPYASLKTAKKLSFKQVDLKVFIYYYRSNRNI